MANLRVTVCELDCEISAFEEGWSRLVAHARERSSEIVLLPEMAFAPWATKILRRFKRAPPVSGFRSAPSSGRWNTLVFTEKPA